MRKKLRKYLRSRVVLHAVNTIFVYIGFKRVSLIETHSFVLYYFAGPIISINLNYVPDWGWFTSINLNYVLETSLLNLNYTLMPQHFHHSINQKYFFVIFISINFKYIPDWGLFTSINLYYAHEALSFPLIWIISLIETISLPLIFHY